MASIPVGGRGRELVGRQVASDEHAEVGNKREEIFVQLKQDDELRSHSGWPQR
jgi:hypothetical protein